MQTTREEYVDSDQELEKNIDLLISNVNLSMNAATAINLCQIIPSICL